MSLVDVAPEVICVDGDSPYYPKRLHSCLQKKAPDILYMQGNVSLLNKPGIGFCGSRSVTEKGLSIAADCAKQSVDRGYVVTSGNARGVDRMVHYIALKEGGETILVLPEGIQHFKIVNDLMTVWDWNRVLVISEFQPNYPWKIWNAMKRNKTILSLIGAMIVVESGEKGGTLEAGKSALRMKIPLFVVDRVDMTSSKGGLLLIEAGGQKLGKSPHRGVANMEPVYLAIQKTLNTKFPEQVSLL